MRASPTGRCSPSPGPLGRTNGGRRGQVIYYQYRHDRAWRTLRSIDEQVAKACNAIKQNRFIQLAGGAHTVNRAPEAKARALAGIEGYITNLGQAHLPPPARLHR